MPETGIISMKNGVSQHALLQGIAAGAMRVIPQAMRKKSAL